MYYLSFLLCLLSIASRVRAELFVSPASPSCEGETVTITCIIQPSSGMFSSSEAAFRINNSNICYSPANINADNTGATNSTRYTYTAILPGSSSTNASGVLEINPFQAIDASIPFACCGDTGLGTFLMFNNTFLTLAAPPFSASISISTTYNSANSCTGTITLTWLAVTSDRAVTSYEVLLNGTSISTITTPMSMNNYTTGTLNLLEYYGTYTVMATSCAGSSISAPVLFIPPIITTVPITTSTTNSDTLTTTSISTTQTTTVPKSISTLPISTPTLPITTNTTNFDNVTLTATTTSPVNNFPTNSLTLSTSVPPNQAYCYLPCTTNTNSVTSTPIIATTTNCTPISTGSSITNDATSDFIYCNSTPYLVGIIILVLLLLLSSLTITILILFIIYSLKKNKSAPKKQQITNTAAPTNTAHIYNYIDLNALLETNEEKHYYSEMATVVQSNTTTTTTTASNTNPTIASTATTNDNTNDRTGYYNVSTYANLS